MGALLRCLVFVASLLLALPPGWCCMLHRNALPTESKSAPRSCCNNHHRVGGDRCNGQTPPQPNRGNAPLPQGTCPCTERLSTPPVSSVTFDAIPASSPL